MNSCNWMGPECRDVIKRSRIFSLVEQLLLSTDRDHIDSETQSDSVIRPKKGPPTWAVPFLVGLLADYRFG
jgi:hypothetical protein